MNLTMLGLVRLRKQALIRPDYGSVFRSAKRCTATMLFGIETEVSPCRILQGFKGGISGPNFEGDYAC